MNEKTMSKADFITSLVLTAFGITATVMAFQMPTLAEKGQGPYAAPGLVPGFLGIIITILGFSMLIRAIIRKGFKDITVKASAGAFLKDEGTRRMGLTILLSLLYGLSLGRIDFSLATFLFAFVFVISFEYDRKETLKAQRKKVLWAGVLASLRRRSSPEYFNTSFSLIFPRSALCLKV